MKKNNGAISAYAVLSMMFFLVFIMIAYNNISQKAKMQVETEGVLVDYYKSNQNAIEIINSKKGGNVNNETKETLLKQAEEQNCVIEDNIGNYVYSNGKIYQIQ